MSLSELRRQIELKHARLAVIGLGYVGLPVACAFAAAGYQVLGVEQRVKRVQMIYQGRSPIETDEPGLADLLAQVFRSGRLQATTDYTFVSSCDVVLVAVETPVDRNHNPDYTALRSALRSLAPVLKTGALVIIESTILPGTTQNYVLPLLEQEGAKKLNQDFYLGCCPERVMPGKLLRNLKEVSRVAGGMTPETAQTMAAFYRHVVQADIDPTDCLTAELVKTVENAYRDVQIAFANEIALACEAVGGDVWKVRDLVNKSPFRQMHLPGAGVGGHCIPKDSWLLAAAVKNQARLRLVPAARQINDGMPLHVAQLLRAALQRSNLELDGQRILVMGYAYLEDSDDTRNSPSAVLIEHLQQTGAQVIIHDPYVSEYQGDLYQAAQDCIAAVLMVRHRPYLELDLPRLRQVMANPLLVDGRNVLDAQNLAEAGFQLVSLGRAASTGT